MKAVIFDLDGVLVSTDTMHIASLMNAISDIIGVDASTVNVMTSKSMLSTKEKLLVVQAIYGFSDYVCNVILLRKDELFLKSIEELSVGQNVIDTLEYLKAHDIKTAIASNSRHININKVLSVTNLQRYFDVIASAEDVLNRKPAPDILFNVYSRLGLTENEYAQTLFIEDSDEGAEAGHRSPSTVLRINNPSELTIELLEPYIQCTSTNL